MRGWQAKRCFRSIGRVNSSSGLGDPLGQKHRQRQASIGQLVLPEDEHPRLKMCLGWSSCNSHGIAAYTAHKPRNCHTTYCCQNNILFMRGCQDIKTLNLLSTLYFYA